MPYQPERLLVEARALAFPLAKRVLEALPGVSPEIIGTPGRIPSPPKGEAGALYAAAKRTMIVGLHPPAPLRGCRPSADYELPLGSSCPGLCQYCYLQSSLGARPYVRVYADLDAILAEAERTAADMPAGASFEASSTSDPVAVEHLTGALAETIAFFGRRERLRLRLVTKFAGIDGLIGLPHAGRTRIRFSLNTPFVTHAFEGGTDPVAMRIDAANRLGRDGYPIGFVLAPLIIYEGWENDYESLLADLADRLEPSLHRGLSFELISHRFTARAKEIIQTRFPHCRLDLDESRRRIRHGRYGRKKFVYTPGELRALWQHLREGIERRFPAAVIEYSI